VYEGCRRKIVRNLDKRIRVREVRNKIIGGRYREDDRKIRGVRQNVLQLVEGEGALKGQEGDSNTVQNDLWEVKGTGVS
jgi:hypothetical protein